MKVLKRLNDMWGNMVPRILSELNYRRFTRLIWECQAKRLHKERWKYTGDFQLISGLIDKYMPTAILDIGCGSGRLFKVYQEKNVSDVTGVDISQKALDLVNKAYPGIKAIRTRLEEMSFERKFDLAVSYRTLQHIPKANIHTVIKKICSCSNLTYINELTESDGMLETKNMFRHGYERFFRANGFVTKEKGMLDKQT